MKLFFLSGLSLVMLVLLIPFGAAEPVARPDLEQRQDGTVHFLVQGEFRSSLNAARESALHEAREQMRLWLLQQNPPIRRVPSLDTIQRQMLRPEHYPPQEEMLKSEMMYKVTIEVELKPSEIRNLRARERTLSNFWVIATLTALAGVTALFFRLDAWTKGYLTRWIAAGAVVLMAAILLLFWSIR